MLTVDNITKEYGLQSLFRNASFGVGAGERIGLIGPNGAGKTTFFRMLMGEEQPDDGEIRASRNYRLALLRQEWLPEPGDTVFEATVRGHPEWYEAHGRLRRAEQELADHHDDKHLARYQQAENAFEILGGHGLEQTAREILSGLGFRSDQFGEPAEQLSGGWRMRCHMAGLLLRQADLLLLDEPTNHLDIDSVHWFEEFLLQYANSFMLISHDRLLIQRLATSILEFAPPQMTMWPGSLQQYEQLKAGRIQQLESTIANKQKEVDRLEDFARRFRAKATKARQSQNRLKTAGHYQQQIEELQASMPVVSQRPASFRLELQRRLPRVVLDIDKAVFGYSDDEPLFELPTCNIEGGKKIGIVGTNGVGKSTFLKSCSGELPLLAGRLNRNDQVATGFFAQHRMEELPLRSVTLDYLSDHRLGNSQQKVRNLAASLGLSGNDMEKPIEVLSGGEKARVSLTRILLSQPEMLLLDEPTNHLDLEACDALKRGLATFEGTLLIVSHNRDFLDALVDYILEVQPGQATLHHGNYSDWLARQEGAGRAGHPLAHPKNASANGEGGKKGQGGKKSQEQKRLEAQQRQERSNRLKGVRQRLSKVEGRMKRTSAAIEELDQKLCRPAAVGDPEFADWVKKHSELSAELPEIEHEWLEATEALERLQQELA